MPYTVTSLEEVMTADWPFKSLGFEILVKSLVHTSTSNACSLFFVNCDVCHIKFIVEKKIEKKWPP